MAYGAFSAAAAAAAAAAAFRSTCTIRGSRGKLLVFETDGINSLIPQRPAAGRCRATGLEKSAI
jgi:hypothetical protein